MVTDAGWAALSATVRRSKQLALEKLCGVDLTKYDDTLPPDVVEQDKHSASNKAVLSFYRACARARIRRRVGAVAVLRTAWRRGNGRPGDRHTAGSRVAALAHMLRLRRFCRVRDDAEVVEPFGRTVVAYL